jgi:hypothetical protein
MTYLLILILQTAHGYAIDRIEAPSYAACEAMRVQYVRDRRVVAARCEVRQLEPGLL